MNSRINSLIYVLGEIFSRVVKFLGTLLIARLVGASGFGIISYLSSVSQYFGFLDFGYTTFVLSESNRSVNKYNYFKIQSIRTITALIGSLCFIILVLFLTNDLLYRFVAIVFSVIIIAQAWNSNWIFTASGNARISGITRMSDGVFFISFAVFLWIIKSNNNIPLAACATLIGMLSVAILSNSFGVIKINKSQDEHTNYKFKFIIKKSFPLSLSMLLITAYNTVDTLILQFYWGSKIVGAYSIAYKIVQFFISIGTIYAQSLVPYFRNFIDNDDWSSISKIIEYGFVIIAFLSAPLIFTVYNLRYLVLLIFGSSFLLASSTFPILILSVPMITAYALLNSILIASQRSNIIIKITLIGVILDTVVSILMIPKYGMVGGGVATLFCEFAILVAEILMLKKFINFSNIIFNVKILKIILISLISELIYLGIKMNFNIWINELFFLIFYFVVVILIIKDIRNGLVQIYSYIKKKTKL